MTKPRNPPEKWTNDGIERILTEALHTGPPDTETLERLRIAASREWQASVNSPRSRIPRPRVWAAAAAALLCLIAAGTWFLRGAVGTEPFGVVVRTEGKTGKISEDLFHHKPLAAAVALHVGDALQSPGAALITLAKGGTLRVAPDTVLKLTSATEIVLQHGKIYLDFPPASASSAFEVSTRAGTIAHVGTAFEVLSNDEMVRIRVREGRVRLRHDSQEMLLDVGTQLTADRAGNITRGTVAPYGRDWLWVAQLVPDPEIEGRPLLEFLHWVAHELGRKVQFADPHAQEVAERTILHGSVKDREPMEALHSVLSTTTLTYEIRGDTIWIQSGHRG